jgi:DNA-binding MltR family transcriptional regulator
MSRNRGRPKPKLRDYSRTALTHEERLDLFDAVAKSNWHPIATAILGAVMVEHEIEILLRARLKKKDDPTWHELLDESGPFRSLHAKITMGHALGIYDEKLRDDLHVVRAIRNAFAHSKKLLTFDNALIIEELRAANSFNARTKMGIKIGAEAIALQACYAALCFTLSSKLMQRRVRANHARNKRAEKRLQGSPLARALMGTLSPRPTKSPPTILESALAGRSAGPKSGVPQPQPGGLFGLSEAMLRKQDK